MFISDLKNDFYSLIIGKRILVIVNYDIDGICASSILSSLFRYDNMVYSVVPIMGISGMKRAFNENKEEIKYVMLINCGGCVDIVELLEPEEDIVFFVCDSHRPYDVCNIYSDRQIRILGDLTTEDNIPGFETIFRESEDEDEEDESDVEDGGTRTDKIEQQIIKRREKRKWEEDRNKIMFEYLQYNYYGRSSALILFDLAWKLSKDSLDLLWWAIIGITEQLLLDKIESSVYTIESEHIQSHIIRLANKINDQNIQTAAKIVFEKDLHLALYRHWSVQESLKHSVYSACKLKLWTLKGEKKLHELLVEMGLPLAQAKQTFNSMDLVLKKEFYSTIEKLSEKYDLPNIVYGSFTLQYGYRNRYSGSDYVYAMLAILESIKNGRSPEFCFLEALDSLQRTNKNMLENGIDMAKQLLTAIFKQVQSSLELHQVYTAGPFLYYILNEENPFFSFPYGLLMLAKFILRGHVAVSRNRRAPELPLVASCPIDMERGLCLMIGIPPVCEYTSKNFFGKAFEQAAKRTNITLLQDFFEPSIVQIRKSDQQKFLDALTVILS